MSVVLEVNHLTIYKGADFEQDFQLTDENSQLIDLTGCQVIAKIKKYPGSKTFNTFDVAVLNAATGSIRLLMSNTTTIFLTDGRNYFDVFVIYPNNKIKPVMRGTILVEPTATSLTVPGQRIGDLGTVDTENISDGEVLMYNQEEQSLEFVNPDKVLEKASEDGLPDEFLDNVSDAVDDRIDIDFGEY
jgi:hypothetical protein